jgi:ATP synthase protein I
LIGAGFGYLVDAKFETAPWGVLVGLVLGFASFVLRLVRLVRQLERLREATEASESETDREP